MLTPLWMFVGMSGFRVHDRIRYPRHIPHIVIDPMDLGNLFFISVTINSCFRYTGRYCLPEIIIFLPTCYVFLLDRGRNYTPGQVSHRSFVILLFGYFGNNLFFSPYTIKKLIGLFH